MLNIVIEYGAELFDLIITTGIFLMFKKVSEMSKYHGINRRR